jgi:hypothetical protein
MPAAVQAALRVLMQHGQKVRKRMRERIRTQKDMYSRRLSKYEEIFENTHRLVNDDFAKKLKSGRGWKGSIKVDEENQKLQISVEPKVGALLSTELLSTELLRTVVNAITRFSRGRCV